MNFLLDTHAILWWLDDNPKFSKTAREIVRNLDHRVFISVVSLVEIRIKQRIGKLTGIPDNLSEILMQSPFDILDFTADHADAVRNFEYFHRDPFDWMLIAQARVENLTLITHDHKIRKYDVEILDT